MTDKKKATKNILPSEDKSMLQKVEAELGFLKRVQQIIDICPSLGNIKNMSPALLLFLTKRTDELIEIINALDETAS